MKSQVWGVILLLLVAVAGLSGCGAGSSGGTETVIGGPSQVNSFSVRVVDDSASRALPRFNSNVTTLVLNIYNSQGQLVGSTSAPRAGEVVLTVDSLPPGPVTVQILAQDKNGVTVQFFSEASNIPTGGLNQVNSAEFVSGSAPPAPGVSPSPAASPVASPGSSPTASPVASPSASPRTSPSAGASPSPGASPSASPATSPSTSPSASPGASPRTSPSSSPGASPAASASPAGPAPSPSPFPSIQTSGNTGSFTMQGSTDNSGQSQQTRDFIAQGKNWTYNNSNAQFSVTTVGNNSSFVRFTVNGTNGAVNVTNPQLWGLDFRGANNSTLVPGTYNNAARASFVGPNQPGLDVSGDGRGANTVFGSFVIYEVVFDPSGKLKRFSADFVERAEQATAPPTTGQIRFSAP